MVNEEGEAQPQNPEQEVEPKAPKRNRKKAQIQAIEFSTMTRINEYGFLHFKKHWLEELGWAKGMERALTE
jgi:hypothetical protein